MKAPRPHIKQLLPMMARGLCTAVWINCGLVGFACLGAFPLTLGHAALSAWNGDLSQAGTSLLAALRVLLVSGVLLGPVLYIYRRFGSNPFLAPIRGRLDNAPHGQFGPRK